MMNVFRDLSNLPNFKNAVLTIGSFDGLHQGHQTILEQVNNLAQQYNGESIVITFYPHPRQVVYPKDKTLQLITTIDEKIQLFEKFGIQNLVIVPFTIEFSQQQADEYIQKFLVDKFNPACIVIGYDHKFGLNRQGDINYLKWASKDYGFDVIEIPKHNVDDIGVSSTKIRNALNEGNVKKAAHLLNHYFVLTGKVVRGQRIGHTIGYPTANILIEDSFKLIPPFGIYATYTIVDGKRYKSMLYIGDRPTLKEFNNTTIEVNIFNFDQDIYGKTIQIEFVDFVREDANFDGLDALKAQLAKDKQSSLAILHKEPFEGIESKKKNLLTP